MEKKRNKKNISIDNENVETSSSSENNENLSTTKDKNGISSLFNSFKSKFKESKLHIDYSVRLTIYFIAFVLIIVMSSIFIKGALDLSTSSTVTYNENSDLDYKVYLKPNDFYENAYLGKDKIYIASLIDNIMIDFKYNFSLAQKVDLKFTYDVIAKLTIKDEISGNSFFEKEYVLLDDKVKTVNDSTGYNLNEQVRIDYAYYNALANKFKQQYGVDAASDLTVSLKINRQTNINGSTNTSNDNTMFVKIPLTERAVNIELNYKDINNSNYIIQTTESVTDNIVYGILALISVIVGIILFIKLIKLINLLRVKKSAYDKYIDRILNEYDRLIVENSTGPDLTKYNIIKISRFEELLDVRDNLKLPIMYYVITKHNKCCFYIRHDGDLYLMTIKAVDIEGK